MAADERSRPLTEADITEFGRQLYEWSKNLPLVQQGLLHRLLSRAAVADQEDAAGFRFDGGEPLHLSTITALLQEALRRGE